MAYIGAHDYNLDVLRGLVPGHTMVAIQGHDNTVPNGGPFDLSPEYGAGGYVFNQSVIAATPAVVGVASTDNTNDNVAGTGALTVRVAGLDASGVAQTNDVTITGTTAVNTANTFSAVFSVTVLTTGSSNGNTGTIHVGTGSFTAGVPAVRMLSMEIAHNVSQSGYYVVPAGKTFYPRQFIGTVGSTNKEVELLIQISSNGILWYTRGEFGLDAGDFTTSIIAIPGIAAGFHIKLAAKGAAAGTIVSSVFAGELIDN